MPTSLGADFARDARHLSGEGVELVDHGVERFLELKDFARHVHGDFLGKVAAGDRGRDVGDIADLRGQVARHEIDVVGEVLPGSGDTGHLGLAAELAFGADFTGDAGDFRRKRVELIDHRVDGVLELQDFTTHVHRDFARKVAAGDRGRDVGDIAYLRGQVAAHRVHGVGQVLPRAGDAGHDGLAAQLAVGTDFAGDAGDFGREGAKLIHHGVDGFLQLQDFAADVHRDLLGQVAVGDGDGDLGDVSNLAGEIVGHGIDALGQVLPDARHLGDLRLAAEFALRPHLARDARHLGGEYAELLDHRVDDGSRLQKFAAQRAAIDIELDGLQQIALRNGGNRPGHLTRGPEQIIDQRIYRAFHVGPGAAGKTELDALPGFPLSTDDLTDTFQLLRHPLIGRDDFIERVGDLSFDPEMVAGHSYREVSASHRLERVKQLLRRVRLSVRVWFDFGTTAAG